jgi:hypothetical protein
MSLRARRQDARPITAPLVLTGQAKVERARVEKGQA